MSHTVTLGGSESRAGSSASGLGGAAWLEPVRNAYREALDPQFPRGCRVALVDFPNHGNVGDSAIWLGEIEYFRQRGAELVYTCTKDTCDWGELRACLGQDGILAVHGGGNFGDLWPQHHQFFHRVLSEFPRHRIVQLPQTLYWSDPVARDRDFESLNRHENLTLFARDRVSLALLRDHCRHTSHLCPDSALLLDLKRPVPATTDMVALMREDKEKGGLAFQFPVATEDWTKDGRQIGFRLARRLQGHLLGFGFGSWANRPALLNSLAGARVDRGCRQVARGRVVVTDRLHVHILCCLMDVPHVVIDNSYGKISTFRECWTERYPRHQLLCRPEELASAIRAVEAMV